ncbi:heme lyase CcmF/NrfE family subunit [Acidiferrobacter sp.]|uniref:heme lyase CcmF/NrfE family subunit n=1 Tax=Acidiferrobacter sp. TaxID=1872107 RepID=UPI00260589D4|nr:heme lyase CcmF/NrfE family subunit [Acidiferrobacter sp.]
MVSGVSLNLIELGHFAAYLAFFVAITQALAPLAARVFKAPGLRTVSVNAAALLFLLTTVGALTIVYSLLTNNFSVLYVASNSNTHLPIFYKIAALWGGHRGSLYLWVWIMTGYAAAVAYHGRSRYPDRLPVIMAVEGALIAGFYGLILFLSDPFTRLFPIPAQGQNMNPLLQDPGMVIHPPMLYMGYVGFSIPFSFAVAALLTNWKSELWIGHTRRWALFAWGFLTAGIIFGAWWSYYVLGWGGYWGWDPVENASFMPWLMGTALIHSISVQERRRMLHTWNIFLIITTFALSLLGTFLVRSGVLASVHAFSAAPGQGIYLLTFMVVVLTLAFGLFLVKGGYQQAEESFISPFSRESMFIWNNVIFTVACASVLLGTLYPLFLQAATGARISVGPPYFDLVMVPIFLIMLVVMAIGPLVSWRKANVLKLRGRLVAPILVGVAFAALVVVVWGPVYWTAPVAVGLVAFVATSIFANLARAVAQRRKQHKEGLAQAFMATVLGNRRHYGGMIVHMGILVIVIGLTGSGLFASSKLVMMAPGDILQVAHERVRFDGTRNVRGPDYTAVQGRLTILNNGAQLRPEQRVFFGSPMQVERPSVNSTPLRDVYVDIGDKHDGKWEIHLFVNPLVNFIWTGGGIVIGGLAFSLSDYVRRRKHAVATSGAVASHS